VSAVTVDTARYRSFPHKLAGHCGSGALRDLLEHHGLDYGRGPLSEGAVFGLAGGLGFLFLSVPKMTPPVYLVGRTAGLERDVAPHLGVGLEVRETDDPQEGWRWVREAIDAGAPPMVCADIAELEYLRVRMANTRHVIVVVDYDDDEQVAYIADNDRDEVQRCSYASLAAARSSPAFPGPTHHATYVYRWPERLRDPSEAVAAALARAIANMREGGELLGGLSGGGGLEGVDDFAASYPTWPERFGPDGLDRALSGLRVFIVKAGTGGAMFRSLHARFLHDMADLLGDEPLRSAARIYDDLAATWIELAGCAERRDHDAGIPLVARVAELEHAGVRAMAAALPLHAG
jgi:hypothetical protein